MMRTVALIFAMLVGADAGSAQAPAAPADALKNFAGAAEIRALIAKAAAAIKPDQPSLVQPLLKFAPYAAALEYRRAAAPPMVHRDQAELVYVIEGTGSFTQGGQLIDATPRDAHNVGGTGITGGTERRVATGDLFVVPEGTPHAFAPIDGRLILITMKVPRSAP